MKKKPSVLLVEDDDLFRETIATILTDAGYLVREAANGQIAQNLLQTDSFNVILSDVRMPMMDGLKLLSYAKASCKSRFILMTGFSEIIEAKKAYAAGADEFLNKPFRTEELLHAVESCCKTSFVSAGTQKVNMDVDYCKIAVESFVSGSKLSSDLFLRLSAYKYIKIANKNTTVPSERIHYYLEKGVSHLYMTKGDFSKYVGLNIKLMTQMSEATDIATDRRLQFIKYNTDLMMQDIYINGISRDRYQDACDIVMNATHLLADCADTLKLLTILREVGDTYSHSLAVSVYATLLAKAHGWTSVSTLSKVAMAGLLHDVGQKEIPVELLDRPRFELKPDELKMMQAHTINGRDILASIPGIPEDISLAALQHHETCSGHGYPHRLVKHKIHPIARLISLTDVFCELIMSGPGHTPQTPAQAYETICKNYENELDSEYFPALRTIVDQAEEEKQITVKGA